MRQFIEVSEFSSKLNNLYNSQKLTVKVVQNFLSILVCWLDSPMSYISVYAVCLGHNPAASSQEGQSLPPPPSASSRRSSVSLRGAGVEVEGMGGGLHSQSAAACTEKESDIRMAPGRMCSELGFGPNSSLKWG